MKPISLRMRFSAFLLLALLLPILAACGGTATPGAATTPEASAPAGDTLPSASPEPSASASPATDASPSPSGSAEASPATGTTGESGDTANFLVYGNPGEPDLLDSMDTTSGQALVVTDQIQETLVGRVEGKVGTQPLLAEEWTANEDSTEWTFKLRQGVKFHDGTDFNADAVVFNFQRMADPSFEFGYRDKGKTFQAFNDIFGGFAGSDTTAWEGIEKVDDFTVKITMKRSFPLLADVLSSSYFGLSSPEVVKKNAEKYGTPGGEAVGTGPFKLESWTPGQNIILVRNDDYWGEKAKMPGAIVRFIADAPARVAELQAGSIDFSVNLPPDSRETLQSDANLQDVKVEPFNIAYIAMNLNSKPLDNPKVRQAIAHAINKQEILDAFYGGVGEVAQSFLPEGLSWARPEGDDPYPYDPEKAKALLAEAGFPDGFDTMTLSDGTESALEFWYMPVSRPYFPTPQPVAEAFAAQLADIGIKVELKTEDWGAYLDNVDAGKKNGMWMLGWTGDYADPNNFLYVFFGPTVELKQGYKNQELITILENGGTAKSQEEAAENFKKAGDIIRQDVPTIPIVHAPPVYGAKKALQGWTPSPFGHEPWRTLSIEK
ncbi:MAG TPA: ABC transporter substrate-binding protein [Herpetosiphonaceae bacterium]